MAKIHYRSGFGSGRNTSCGIRAKKVTGIKDDVSCKRCIRVLDSDRRPKKVPGGYTLWGTRTLVRG